MKKGALMIVGTASHVGKSILTAGLGRILADEGYRVAPFKAQNMSLNSAATPEGGEIGRAQALQAEACRAVPCVEMNPVLLKPSTDTGAQVIVLGKIWAQVTASDYHTRSVEQLFPAVLDAYRRLAARHDLMLLEGAGSVAEINLRDHDIVNMRMAHAADAACLLVADIDRGGVFGSLLGTLELLDRRDRSRIRGFVINKFRGDLSLLLPGVRALERRLNLPCAGIVPHLPDLGLDEEDGVALNDIRSSQRRWKVSDRSPMRPLRVGVIGYPHMANFTDFDALSREPSVSLAFVQEPEDLAGADVVILPGSKQTIDDLQWVTERGFARELHRLSEAGAPMIGICGGFQMLGNVIEDPCGIENGGEPRSRPGLGLLPIRTVLRGRKITRRVEGRVRCGPLGDERLVERSFHGYEIHVGETIYETGTQAFAEIAREGMPGVVADGAVNPSGRVFGTYVHGLFDCDEFRHSLIDATRAAVGLSPASARADVDRRRQDRIDRLANHLRRSMRLDLIRSWLVAPSRRSARKA